MDKDIDKKHVYVYMCVCVCVCVWGRESDWIEYLSPEKCTLKFVYH
jgi:hypothetical protein